jgi:hypothetical protein
MPGNQNQHKYREKHISSLSDLVYFCSFELDEFLPTQDEKPPNNPSLCKMPKSWYTCEKILCIITY